LTEIDRIKPLHPEDTDLVPDTSARYSSARLYLESLLRQSPPTDSDLWVGHRAAIDVMPYQLDPAIQALGQIRHRILLADSVGLGKTIEVGILLAELIRRGKGKRILVVTTKSMMTQFQKELWSRFTIPLVRLDRAGIDRIRQEVPADANPFHYFDKTIISVDTLKQERDFRVHLEKSYWDIIVIDEAHNVAVRGSKSARAKLAEVLAHRSDTMILASATPHDGRPESFASLMNMLNPTAIPSPKNYGPEDIAGLFLRRFRKQVQAQIGQAMLPRDTKRYSAPASAAEEQAYDRLVAASFASFDKGHRSGQLLFRTVLEKAIFSSPAACLKTIAQRLNTLASKTTPEAAQDRKTLGDIATAVETITPDRFSRYQTLLGTLRPGGTLDWHPERADDRVVIFTERIETLNFLKKHLEQDLKLKPAQIATLSGQESDDAKLQDTVQKFGQEQEPVRLLIATDIASEGINLHFLSHKLIHFDIPWSLMVFQQRNGRVDRYGQKQQPRIAYLCTESINEKIRGDQRILQLLTLKDEKAQENIGDPSAFLGAYDQAQEEIETGKAIEQSLSADEFNRRMEETARSVDLLALLAGDTPPPTGATAPEHKRTAPSLYASDVEYVVAALRRGNRYDFQYDPQRQMISLTIPRDLERILKRTVPKGSLPEDGRLHLTSDSKLVQQDIENSRSGDRTWPQIHLLWDLHPAVEWLNYKLLVNFGRAEAPVVTLEGVLQRGELVFLMQGEIPNRKGQPVVHSWFGVRFESGKFTGIEPLEAFLHRTGFHRKQFANPAHLPDVTQAKILLPEAVAHSRKHMSRCRETVNTEMAPKLAAEEQKLEHLRVARRAQLDIDFGDTSLAGIRLRQKESKQRRIDEVFADWTAYVRDTLTTEDAAFVRVAGVFRGE
jgi:superfamily II DNA or RNA helicase